MDRRNFIRITSLSAFAASVSGFTFVNSEGMTVGDCQTTSDMLGPFFREGAPVRNDLNYNKRKGEELKVVGQVFASDCKSPLADVFVDVWHCDHRGKYDNRSQNYRCRAKVKTNQQGHFWFKTIIPPAYKWRPIHIHLKVSGVPRHQELVTQIYFQGDKVIGKEYFEKNPWSEGRTLDPKRVLELYKNSENMNEVKINLTLTEADR